MAEAYPALKADRNFLELQKELVNTEDRIQAARRFYNGNVRDYPGCGYMISNTLLAGVYGLQVYRLKIGRTCSGTSRDGLRHTIQRPNYTT